MLHLILAATIMLPPPARKILADEKTCLGIYEKASEKNLQSAWAAYKKQGILSDRFYKERGVLMQKTSDCHVKVNIEASAWLEKLFPDKDEHVTYPQNIPSPTPEPTVQS